MVGIKVSQGHYEVTSPEVVDSLNPIVTFLEWKKVAVPADPADNTLMKIFYDTATNRFSGRRRNDADTAYITVDLEGGGGGGTSFIAFTADADLNMGAFDITTNVAPATNIFKIIFDGSEDSDTYISNSTTTPDRINIWVGNDNIIAFTQTITNFFDNLQMNTGKIQASTGNNLKLDTIDAGAEIELLKPVIMGSGSMPSGGQQRFSDTDRINWESTSGGDHGIAFDTDVFRIILFNLVHYTFTASTMDVTGANIVNVGLLNGEAIVQLSGTQTFTGLKAFDNLQVNDSSPSFISGSISRLAIQGTAVNLTTVQTITAEKSFDDLVVSVGGSFVCLATVGNVTFQGGSIQGGAIVDNTLGLDSMVHSDGGRIITFTSGDVPAYLIAGNDGEHLESHGVGSAISWESTLRGIQQSDTQLTAQSIEFEFDGNWLSNGWCGGDVADTTSISEDVSFYVPLWLGQRCKVTNLGFMNWVGTGSLTVQMALYSNRTDGTNYPASRLEEDIFNPSNTTDFKITDGGFIDQQLEAGLYWICIILQNTTIGTSIEIMKHNSTGAVNAGWHYNDNTPAIQATLGYAGADTSMPSTADSDMTAVAENPPALFAQVVPY